MSYAQQLLTIGQSADAELAALQEMLAAGRLALSETEALLGVTAAERDALTAKVAALEARIAELEAQTPPPVDPPVDPPPSGSVIRVAGSDERSIDAAFAKASPGSTIYFPRGRYEHADIRLSDGMRVRGDGIGKTVLNFGMSFGSNCMVGGLRESEGLTLGRKYAFGLTNGAHDTTFAWTRFRRPSGTLWDLCDFTHNWSDPARCNKGNFHAISWTDCEFECTGGTDPLLFNIWFDSRRGGGSIYDLEWRRCTFGARNASGRFGQGRMGILLQPSPPEHAKDGPRPAGVNDPSGINSTAFGFDFGQVTHGSGLACVGAKFGFRVIGNRFVGPASFASFDLCDYLRAWSMVHYRLTEPRMVTDAMRAQAPDAVTSKGWDVRDNWMSGKFIRENGRNVVATNNLTSQGASAYNVTSAVSEHDRELYG